MNERWIVELDDNEHGRYRTRREAREHADWLRGHPACADRRMHGHGGRVEVIDRRGSKMVWNNTYGWICRWCEERGSESGCGCDCEREGGAE